MEPGSNLVHDSALLFYIRKLKPNELNNRHEDKKAPLGRNIKLRSNYCTDLLIYLQLKYLECLFIFFNRQTIFLTITVSPTIMPKLPNFMEKSITNVFYRKWYFGECNGKKRNDGEECASVLPLCTVDNFLMMTGHVFLQAPFHSFGLTEDGMCPPCHDGTMRTGSTSPSASSWTTVD